MIDTRLAPYAVFVLRLTLGLAFLAHGLIKVFVFTIPGTVGFFEKIGYPGELAYYVIVVEVIGGAALVLGVWTRAVAIVSLPVLAGAFLTHVHNGFTFSNPNGGWEFPAIWAIMLMVQAMIGDGALALKPTPVFSRSRNEAIQA